MELHVKGLKCDNPACGWADMGIPFEEYPEWTGRPCPLCGQVVLTEKDMNTIRVIGKICRSKPVRFFERMAEQAGKRNLVFFGRMNGSGKIEFTDAREERRRNT